MKDEKNKTSWLPLGMSIGLSIGLAIGSLMGKTATGMCIGLGLGMAIGGRGRHVGAVYTFRKCSR